MYLPHNLQSSSLTHRPLELKAIKVASNQGILTGGKLRPKPGQVVQAGGWFRAALPRVG